jgi:hypothetical protein
MCGDATRVGDRVRSRFLAALVAVASVLLLAGCGYSRPVVQGPTSAEVRAFSLKNNDAQLQRYSIAAQVQSPSIDLVHFVSDSSRKLMLKECMTAAGYSVFVADPVENQALNQEQREQAVKYQIAESVCAAKNPPDPSKYGLLGTAQRAYLYDYYVRWLLPCLESSGYRLADAPSRSKFIDDWPTPGWWSPYDSIGDLPDDAALARLQDKCPPRPPGLN